MKCRQAVFTPGEMAVWNWLPPDDPTVISEQLVWVVSS